MTQRFGARRLKIRRYIILAIWCLGIIIPTAALVGFSSSLRSAFNTIFAPNWMHVFMHIILFAVLALILAPTLALPHSWRAIFIISGVIFGIGLLQEEFQAIQQGFFSPENAIADLGVDLCGGTIGMVIVYGLAAIKSRAYWAS
jgi:hypothetical protein